MNAQRLTVVGLPAGQPYVMLVEGEVEDEALAQRVLKKYRISNHVDWYRDGEEALRALKERLSTPSQFQARPSPENVPAAARPRSMEAGASGITLLPSQAGAARPQDPSSMAPKAAGSLHPARDLQTSGRVPELILLSAGQRGLLLDLVKRFRALPGMGNVPIAICCRSAEEELQARGIALPRVSVLSKPIGFFKLLECIQKMDMHWLVFSERP